MKLEKLCKIIHYCLLNDDMYSATSLLHDWVNKKVPFVNHEDKEFWNKLDKIYDKCCIKKSKTFVCSDCRHYKIAKKDILYNCCHNPNNTKYLITDYYPPEELNKNNDCLWFERKC